MKKVSTSATLGLAVVTGAAVAASYLLYGSKNASQNRAQVAAWAKKAEKEVLTNAKKLKGALSEETLSKLIDDAAERYAAAKGVEASDVKIFVKNMQRSLAAARAAVVKELKKNNKAVRASGAAMAKKSRASARKVSRSAKKMVS